MSSKEERFWLSQQALSLIRKFSGRELSELEEIVEWLKRQPKEVIEHDRISTEGRNAYIKIEGTTAMKMIAW